MERERYDRQLDKKRIMEHELAHYVLTQLSKARVRVVKKVTRNNYVLEIDNHFFGGQKGFRYKGVASEGSSVVIKGKTKSRKSSIVYMILAAAIHNANFGGDYVRFRQYENFVCRFHVDQYIIHIDTEQNEFEYHRALGSISRMAELTTDQLPSNFVTFSFKTIAGIEAKTLALKKIVHDISSGLDSRNPDGKIAMLFIDHVGDFITNKNDPTEVNAYIKMITEFETMGIVVIQNIHTNKSNDFATGLLGGEMEKKASMVIKVAKLSDDDDDDIPDSEVMCEYDRGGEKFRSFRINWDESGFLVSKPNEKFRL